MSFAAHFFFAPALAFGEAFGFSALVVVFFAVFGAAFVVFAAMSMAPMSTDSDTCFESTVVPGIREERDRNRSTLQIPGGGKPPGKRYGVQSGTEDDPCPVRRSKTMSSELDFFRRPLVTTSVDAWLVSRSDRRVNRNSIRSHVFSTHRMP